MPLSAEYVFLKDGAIVEGTITSDAAGTVTVRTKENKSRSIPRSNIMRILYTELYMGKVYVQKTDGKNVICYMVDEDRESYTFRKELYNPEEFKLRRDQVLFMARGNPTGLEGEAGTDRVDLKWFPPYNPVKRYRIYIKGPGEKAYKLADETGSKNITLKGLKSNTKYFIYVTALDSAGDESLPSNELVITTKNLPPSKPEILSIDKLPAGGYRITWKESSDFDGKLAGYKVYKKLDREISVIGETKKTEFVLLKNEKFDGVFISAVDDLKAESDLSTVYTEYRPEIGISVNPAFLYPLGKLKDMADYGYGAEFKLELLNYFLPKLELSADTSLFYLPGKGDFYESESKVISLMFAPVMLSAGYAFYLLENFAVIPNVSAGAIYVQYDYSYFDIPDSKEKNVSDYEIDPALGAGILFRYLVTDSVYVNLSADYRIFFEESGSFSYCTAAVGAGFRF
jgi:hypothetical protein